MPTPTRSDVLAYAFVTTTNAAQTTLVVDTMTEDNCSNSVLVTVIARRLSDGATKSWKFNASAKRTTGDAEMSAQLLGNAVGTSGDLLALTLTSVAVDAVDQDMRVRVTGLGGTSILWFGRIEGDEICEGV